MTIPFNKDLLKWHEMMELDNVFYSNTPAPKKIAKLEKIIAKSYTDNFKSTDSKYANLKSQNSHPNSGLNNNITNNLNISNSNILSKRINENNILKPNFDQVVNQYLSNSNPEITDSLEKCSSISELKNILMNFNGCSLKIGAKNTVFSDGNPNSKIMLIGEAPGANEDELGIPFCGASGKLLDQILLSIGLTRENNCYITNTVFWRPPGNRAPTNEEIEICRPFLEKHIALMNPSLIILVGATAITSVLGNQFSISKIRKSFFQYSNKFLTNKISVTGIFHPAYLLRQPMRKKDVWYDMINIKEFIKNIE